MKETNSEMISNVTSYSIKCFVEHRLFFIRMLKADCISPRSITKPLNTIRNNKMKISYRAIHVLLRRI